MKIEPRKESDRGGYLCMPRFENCPDGKPGWKKIHCPVWGLLLGETGRCWSDLS